VIFNIAVNARLTGWLTTTKKGWSDFWS